MGDGRLRPRGARPNRPAPITLASVAVRNARPELPKGVEIGGPEAALDADVVVELAGGIDGPLGWARLTLDRGTPYVTANKALLATHGKERRSWRSDGLRPSSAVQAWAAVHR